MGCVVMGSWKSPRRHVAEGREREGREERRERERETEREADAERDAERAIRTWPNLPIASTERLGCPSRSLLRCRVAAERRVGGSGEACGAVSPNINVKGRPTWAVARGPWLGW